MITMSSRAAASTPPMIAPLLLESLSAPVASVGIVVLSSLGLVGSVVRVSSVTVQHLKREVKVRGIIIIFLLNVPKVKLITLSS